MAKPNKKRSKQFAKRRKIQERKRELARLERLRLRVVEKWVKKERRKMMIGKQKGKG